MDENKNNPELRFSEFDDKWRYRRIYDVLNTNAGRDYKHLNYGEYPVFGTGGYMLSVDDFLCKSDAIGIGRKGTIDKPYLLKGPFWTVDTLFYCIPKEGNNVYFLLNLFKTVKWQKYDESTGVPSLSKKTMDQIKIIIPSNSEQQKIGNFFSKLDRRIELEEKKLALLEEQKKGYMQKIFSQELRFKDDNGNDYPEWEEDKLGNLGNTFSGLSGKTKNDFGYGEGIFITYMNVFKNVIGKPNMVEKVSIKDNEKQHKVKQNDILFTTSSEVPEETGMSSLWPYDWDNIYLNSFCFGFTVTTKSIKPEFLVRLLRGNKLRKKITILAQGSTRFNISKKEMMKLPIDIPDIDEQKKIGAFLQKIDDRIERQTQKIEALKTQKQGFLQKMFV